MSMSFLKSRHKRTRSDASDCLAFLTTRTPQSVEETKTIIIMMMVTIWNLELINWSWILLLLLEKMYSLCECMYDGRASLCKFFLLNPNKIYAARLCSF